MRKNCSYCSQAGRCRGPDPGTSTRTPRTRDGRTRGRRQRVPEVPARGSLGAPPPDHPGSGPTPPQEPLRRASRCRDPTTGTVGPRTRRTPGVSSAEGPPGRVPSAAEMAPWVRRPECHAGPTDRPRRAGEQPRRACSHALVVRRLVPDVLRQRQPGSACSTVAGGSGWTRAAEGTGPPLTPPTAAFPTEPRTESGTGQAGERGPSAGTWSRQVAPGQTKAATLRVLV